MTELAVIIPSRCEMFLKNTIEDLLANIEGDTEIIAVLDGQWADPPVDDHERVTLIYHPQAIGQRAATNEGVKITRAKYVMKVDAHCSFDKGFDAKMLAAIDGHDDWTMAPLMRNLHVFDWVCPNGHRRYQGPSGPCKECGEPTTMDIVWYAKPSPQSTSYCFDATPHFQYFGEYRKRPEAQGKITESMSLQGSCFMMLRERYLELNVCDEAFGFWGSQGIEVACKSWLSGGSVMVNSNTWYAHMFRTQGADFSFPYPLSGKQTESAKKMAHDLFFTNSWPKQVRPLSWLVEKFWPVPGWGEDDLRKLKEKAEIFEVPKAPEVPKVVRQPKGVVYYTDNRLSPLIMNACQKQLEHSVNGHRIVSVSLGKLDFGDNIVMPLERGYLTLFKQILMGLESLDSEIVFLAEHDILYHPSHFDFVPPDPNKVYYNLNWYKVRLSDGHALRYDSKQQSQICAYRDLLVEHYRKRVARTQEKLFQMGDTREYRNWIRQQGFEAGTHGRPERVDDLQSDVWYSPYPNLDIRHDANLTPNRWRQDQFRNQRSCRNWVETDEIPGWGITKDRFTRLLEELGG